MFSLLAEKSYTITKLHLSGSYLIVEEYLKFQWEQLMHSRVSYLILFSYGNFLLFVRLKRVVCT